MIWCDVKENVFVLHKVLVVITIIKDVMGLLMLLDALCKGVVAWSIGACISLDHAMCFLVTGQLSRRTFSLVFKCHESSMVILSTMEGYNEIGCVTAKCFAFQKLVQQAIVVLEHGSMHFGTWHHEAVDRDVVDLKVVLNKCSFFLNMAEEWCVKGCIMFLLWDSSYKLLKRTSSPVAK